MRQMIQMYHVSVKKHVSFNIKYVKMLKSLKCLDYPVFLLYSNNKKLQNQESLPAAVS